MGLLSWTPLDLAVADNAECIATDPTNCRGLQYPLSDATVAIVALHFAGMSPSLVEDTELVVWTSNMMPFSTFTNTQYAAFERNGICFDARQERTEFQVIANHLYMDHVLQITYTAAILYLLENATVFTYVTASRPNTSTALNFAEKLVQIDLVAKVATVPALLTCGAALFGSRSTMACGNGRTT